MSAADTGIGPERRALVHKALLYRDAEELAFELRGVARQCARGRQVLMALLPGPSLELMRRSARELLLDVRLEDSAEVARNPGVALELIEQWAQAHPGRARVISELTWPGRRHAEMVECLRHEALIDSELAGCELSLLCLYDLERLEPEVVEGVRLTHPSPVPGGRERGDARRRSEELLSPTIWPQELPREPIVELRFTGDLQRLRADVAAAPVIAGLEDDRRADLVFAVNEAATNAIKHADGRCEVRLWHDGTAVVAEVRSRSRLTDPAAGRRCPPARAPGGRGLWLVNHVCDLVELRSRDDQTWVRMHILDPSPTSLPARAAGSTAG